MPRFRNPVVSTANILDGSVTTPKLADAAVSSIKLATDLQSDNYVAGVSGWKIERDTGGVEFGSGTFRGTIVATGGELGTLSVDGTLTMGATGLIRTSVSGPRVTLSDNGLDFFDSGLAGHITAGGFEVIVSAENALRLHGYAGQTQIVLSGAAITFTSTSASFGGSISASSVLVQKAGDSQVDVFNTQNLTGARAFARYRTGSGWGVRWGTIQNSYWIALMDVNGGVQWGWTNAFVRGPAGTATVPAYSRIGDPDSGIYFPADGYVNIAGNASGLAVFGPGDIEFPGAGATTNSALPAWRQDSSSGSVLLRLTSSRRWKTAIRDAELEPYVELLDGLRLRHFRSRLGADDRRRRLLGLIAEEVHALPLGSRFTDPADADGHVAGVHYEGLIPVLIAGYQHLAARVAVLESR